MTKPAATSEGRALGYADATTGTINALYTPQFWKFLTSGLLGLRRGTDPGDLLTLADEYYGRDAKGHYNIRRTRSTRSVASTRRSRPIRRRGPTPIDGYVRSRRSRPTGSSPAMRRDLCGCGRYRDVSPHPAAPVAPGKVVVVSTTHDPPPHTKPESIWPPTRRRSDHLEGTQHTVTFNGNDCVDGAVVRYLVDGAAPGNLRC